MKRYTVRVTGPKGQFVVDVWASSETNALQIGRTTIAGRDFKQYTAVIEGAK